MLTGDLAEFRATDALGLLGRARATGALAVEGDLSARVYLAEGDVTFATTRAGSSLADLLVRARFLDAADWTEAATSDDPATAVARALAAGGADPARLTAVLQGRTEEAMFEIGLWRTGTFHFRPGEGHLLGDAFRFPATDLLARVDDRRRRWDDLLGRVGSIDHVVHPHAGAGDDGSDDGSDDDLVLSRSQFRVLTTATRGLPVRDLADELDLGLFAACELIAGLVDRGLLVTLPPGPGGTPAPFTVADFAAPAGITFDHHVVATIDDVAVAPAFAPVLEPVGALASTGGGEWSGSGEFVAPGDAPARDLILRLLTAVKEL